MRGQDDNRQRKRVVLHEGRTFVLEGATTAARQDKAQDNSQDMRMGKKSWESICRYASGAWAGRGRRSRIYTRSNTIIHRHPLFVNL